MYHTIFFDVNSFCYLNKINIKHTDEVKITFSRSERNYF